MLTFLEGLRNMYKVNRALSVAIVCCLFSAIGTSLAAQGRSARVADLIDQMEIDARGGVRTTVSDRTGFITFVSTQPGQSIAVRADIAAPANERALEFVSRFGSAFGVAAEDLVVEGVSGFDQVGMEHVRFRQTHQGVPITGGEVIVHLRGSGVVAANAKAVVDFGDVEVTPRISPQRVAEIASELLTEEMGVIGATLSEPRLELLNKGHLSQRTSATRLAWFIEARKVNLREFIWIDALAGKKLLQFSQLTDAKDRKIYDADDPGDGVYDTLPGALVRSEGGAATGDSDTDLAYTYSGDTYDYFFTEHGRDSYDDAGATLVSSVHFCPDAGSCPFANAFWNGSQMVYGDGFPVADDVVAHELTHAVTERTANLFYYMQSGALNESYSDIFGETVDLTNTGGAGGAENRWLLGEDIGAIRDMMDPSTYEDPGKMSDELVCNGGGGQFEDQGGVHTNSGIPNHAYALMVDGGTYNGFTVAGIGLTKAGKVQYRALSQYLTSASDFLDNYNALFQSCLDLVGTAGITGSDCAEVGKSLLAVEMNDPWSCTPPTQAEVPAFCDPGVTLTTLSTQDFSGGGGLAACPGGALPTAWCANGTNSLLGPFATSGTTSAWGYNRPTTGSLIQSFAGANPLPANARLQFNHSFGFENTFPTTYWDGGVVEYSTNGGSTWTDAGGLILAGQAYGGTVSNSFGNPLGGQSAFVGESWGFTATQIDLSSLAGTNFHYRFNVGTDSIFDDYGWFVDDVNLFTCGCVTDINLALVDNGSGTFFRATNSITAGSGYTVGVAETVEFGAGNVVMMENGFTVANGANFSVHLTPCP